MISELRRTVWESTKNMTIKRLEVGGVEGIGSKDDLGKWFKIANNDPDTFANDITAPCW
jgi:hypothetical protein